MKKFSLLLVCGILLATLAGCGGDAGDAGASATATTGTTTTGTAVSTTESTTAAETAATTEQTADDTTTDIATTTGAATTTTKATTQATTKATTRTTTKAAATTKSSPAYKSYTEGRISFKLPSHFAKIMEEPVLFVSEDYPQIGDNFALIVTDKDPEFNNFTKEDYTAQLETVFSGLVVSEFYKTTVAGRPAYRGAYTIYMDGQKLTGVQVLIDADKTYSLTYTLVNGDLKDHVEASIQSITFQ